MYGRIPVQKTQHQTYTRAVARGINLNPSLLHIYLPAVAMTVNSIPGTYRVLDSRGIEVELEHDTQRKRWLERRQASCVLGKTDYLHAPGRWSVPAWRPRSFRSDTHTCSRYINPIIGHVAWWWEKMYKPYDPHVCSNIISSCIRTIFSRSLHVLTARTLGNRCSRFWCARRVHPFMICMYCILLFLLPSDNVLSSVVTETGERGYHNTSYNAQLIMPS